MTPVHYWVEVESEFRGTCAKVGASKWSPIASNLEVAEVVTGKRLEDGHIYVWLNRGLILKTKVKEEAIGVLRRLFSEAPPEVAKWLEPYHKVAEKAVTG